MRPFAVRVKEGLRYMGEECGVGLRPRITATSSGQRAINIAELDWIDLGDPQVQDDTEEAK